MRERSLHGPEECHEWKSWRFSIGGSIESDGAIGAGGGHELLSSPARSVGAMISWSHVGMEKEEAIVAFRPLLVLVA